MREDLSDLQKALELNATYATTSEELDDKHNETERARDLSKRLRERADNIFKMTVQQKSQLKGLLWSLAPLLLVGLR